MMNSFELLSHTIDERVHIDKEYYYTKEEQCKWCVCVRGKSTLLLVFLLSLITHFYKVQCSQRIGPLLV